LTSVFDPNRTSISKGKLQATESGYGYGLRISTDCRFERIVGHGGGAPGVNTMLQIYPDQEYCVIVLSNYDPPSAEDIAAKAREVLLGAAASQGGSHP